MAQAATEGVARRSAVGQALPNEDTTSIARRGQPKNRLGGAVYRAASAVERLVAGEHPRATILHPQWLSIRAQRAGAEWSSSYARGILLDLGCGRRPFEPIFRSRIEAYIGLDYPVTAHAAGGSRADVYASAEHAPIRDGSVETVMLTEVLEHVPEPAVVLAEAFRVLKPGGILIASAPLFYNVHGGPFDYYRFTAEGLRLLLERAGFQVVAIRPQGRLGTTLGVLMNNFLTLACERHRLLQALRWTTGMPLAWAIFACVNLAGWLLDGACRDDRFGFNHLAIARKT